MNNGSNCTNYAAYRLASNGVPNPGNLGNAGGWDTNALAKGKGFTVDSTPAPGAIAQWNQYEKGVSSAGHVAYVDYVEGDQVWLSESNWSGPSKLRVANKSEVGRFIHFKDLGSSSVENRWVAFQANTGDLHVTDGSTTWNPHQGMAAGTSPSITTLGSGYRVAFQANTGELHLSTDGATTNTRQGMKPGSRL
ncbi:CHAP domain-containing protein [Oerskovia sp. NPDC060338]|uniref:CHAP domain-containing protein n=1 Tax=Oerskovia sp. NPDC060338 TaxID=3347100 RepID=UPI00364A41CA